MPREKKSYVEQSVCFVHQKTFMEKIDEVKEKINEMEVAIAGLPEALIQKLDARYADKKSVDSLEDTVRWVTRLILGAVILAIVALVIKN